MDLIEQQVLIKPAEKKSPGLAAVMGFFFPLVGMGLFLLLVYGFAGAYQCHKWAKEYNDKELAKLVATRRAQSAGAGV